MTVDLKILLPQPKYTGQLSKLLLMKKAAIISLSFINNKLVTKFSGKANISVTSLVGNTNDVELRKDWHLLIYLFL